mmetsp:Transcript_79630/g.215353  ORF Transcript_79630/g.215353 Transcript_79630/m.215353 type:complete len:207 (-) Transcript_79630:329-949(-)
MHSHCNPSFECKPLRRPLGMGLESSVGWGGPSSKRSWWSSTEMGTGMALDSGSDCRKPSPTPRCLRNCETPRRCMLPGRPRRRSHTNPQPSNRRPSSAKSSCCIQVQECNCSRTTTATAKCTTSTANPGGSGSASCTCRRPVASTNAPDSAHRPVGSPHVRRLPHNHWAAAREATCACPSSPAGPPCRARAADRRCQIRSDPCGVP